VKIIINENNKNELYLKDFTTTCKCSKSILR